MTGWLRGSWMGFDTETTGISPWKDRIVTGAVVVRVGGIAPTGSDSTRGWLLNPGVEIPALATSIHGISTREAEEHGQDPKDALDEINARLAENLLAGNPVIVFNAGFDLPLLENDSKRHGVTPLSERVPGGIAPVLDPLALDRGAVPRRRGKRTLSALCEAYRVSVPAGTHQAHVDAELTLNLLAALLTAHPNLQGLDVPGIMQFQRESHARWAESLEAWHRSQGRTRSISTVWF